MKLKIVFIITVTTVLIMGCLTQEKAVNFLKDKKVLDDVCAENYPTPIKETDSSAYKASLKTLDSLLATYEVDSLLYEQEINELRTKIKKLLEGDTLLAQNDTLCESVYNYAAKQQREKDALQKQVSALSFAIRNIKPIKEQVIDSAYTQTLWDRINLLQAHDEKVTDSLNAAKAEIKEFKHDKKQPLRVAGWFAIALASQWWFWVLVAGLVGYFFRGTIFKVIKSFIKI